MTQLLGDEVDSATAVNEHWRERMAAAVEGEVVDAERGGHLVDAMPREAAVAHRAAGRRDDLVGLAGADLPERTRRGSGEPA